MTRGDIYLADLGSGMGSEQTGTRPVILVQADSLSRFSETAVVIPLTTNLRRAQIPGCLVLRQGEGGLTQDSVALCYQIRVLSKQRLLHRLGTLPVSSLSRLEAALKITLDLN